MNGLQNLLRRGGKSCELHYSKCDAGSGATGVKRRRQSRALPAIVGAALCSNNFDWTRAARRCRSWLGSARDFFSALLLDRDAMLGDNI